WRICRHLPFGDAIDRAENDSHRLALPLLALLEDADLGPVNEAGVVCSCQELHSLADPVGPPYRIRRDIEQGSLFEPVELDLNVHCTQRAVSPALRIDL